MMRLMIVVMIECLPLVGLFCQIFLLTMVMVEHSPLVCLVDTDGSLILQVTYSADSSVPPKLLHLRPCCRRHRASEAKV